MPLLIIAEKGKSMDKKKKGFLDYGKEDEEPEGEESEDSGDEGASEMRIKHLAEQTGVENPEALIKLIKACMAG